MAVVLQWGQRLSALDTPEVPPDSFAHEMLQWGQRLSALDTRAKAHGGLRYGMASMGPTPFSVGYDGGA